MYLLPIRFGYIFSCLLIVLMLLSASTLSVANPKKVLILDSQSGAPYDAARDAMLKELRHQGYSIGGNLEITRYDIHNKTGLARRILQMESSESYDAIFVNGTIANQAAFQFGYGRPEYKFIFCSITDPVGEGLIEALGAPPESNFTGVTYGLPVEARLRFLLEVLPDVKTIGMIYAEMPQSLSYVGKLKTALELPEFSHLKIVFHPISFVNSDFGHLRMAKLLQNSVQELDPIVDVYMTPSDQLGIKREYAQVVTSLSVKPLMGLSKKEVQAWGAHFGLYPIQEQSGKIAGNMVAQLLRGESISAIIPTHPKGEYGINKTQSEKIGLHYPDAVLVKAGANVFK